MHRFKRRNDVAIMAVTGLLAAMALGSTVTGWQKFRVEDNVGLVALWVVVGFCLFGIAASAWAARRRGPGPLEERPLSVFEDRGGKQSGPRDDGPIIEAEVVRTEPDRAPGAGR